MRTTSLDLTVPPASIGTKRPAMASFLTASLLQLCVFGFLTIAPLMRVSPPPPPRVRPLGFVVGVSPRAAVPAPVGARVPRRAPRAPSLRYERLVSAFTPDRIPDAFGWDVLEMRGSVSGETWGIWKDVPGAPIRPGEIEEPRPVRVGGQIQPPKKTKHVDPVYPELARAVRIQGVVILEAVIDPQGRVRNVKVLRSVPFLDDAAIAAVEQWEYRPTQLNGVPVPVIVTVTVRFSVSGTDGGTNRS